MGVRPTLPHEAGAGGQESGIVFFAVAMAEGTFLCAEYRVTSMESERKPGSRDVNKRYGERTKHHVSKHGEALRDQARKKPLMTLKLVHRAEGEPDEIDPRIGLRPLTEYSLNKHKRWEWVEQLEADPTVVVRHEPKHAMMRRREPSLRHIVRHRQALVDVALDAPLAEDGTPTAAPVPLKAVYWLSRDPTAAERTAHAVHNTDGNKCHCLYCSSYDSSNARSDKRKSLIDFGLSC